MKISLVLKNFVDENGPNFRMCCEIKQLGLPADITAPPPGFKDWGVVEFGGVNYYMSSYNPP